MPPFFRASLMRIPTSPCPFLTISVRPSSIAWRKLSEKALDASVNARVTLMAGFTTVRDVGSSDYLDVGLRNAIRDGVVPGPRMLVTVHALGSTGGHCDFQDGFRQVLFGHESGPLEGVINGPDEARY